MIRTINFTVILTLTLFLLNTCGKYSGETFKKLSPAQSGIRFFNELIENDTLNYTKFPFMYMGGGVSIGDINNDGLDDIFFTGNLVPNKLYLNKGNLHFEDISEKAGIEGNKQWFTGATMADVNNDGWLDIYVCVSAKYQPSDNLLFINNKDNTFTECAESYGINDKSSSVQATFFDYNNDGLLDLYVATYPIVLVSMGAEFYRDKMKENRFEESGHMYRNNGDQTFTDVTDEAGVRNFGMSIGVVAVDFNNDGWKDLYVSNDFNPPDYFYLNNKDGTFSEVLRECTFQTSIFGMGLDAADINNDGFMDICQIDMTPPGHSRRMINVIPMSQPTFDNSIGYGFHYQYMQNSLQLNNGIFNGKPVFSNIALLAGMAYTDWSWGGLLIDLDNDGLKDLFVSNGVLKDINNQDILGTPRSDMYFIKQKTEYRPELFPSTPIPNFVFKNNGDLTFTNKNNSWGFNEPNLTNGLSCSDLDNDGDLDIVINNVNKMSSVYENRVAGKNNHYLKIRLNGPDNNRFGLGSIIQIRSGSTFQKQELTLTRGYQSSLSPVVHFGLGKDDTVSELQIIWPDGKQQIIHNVQGNQTIILDYTDASDEDFPANETIVLKDITSDSGIGFIHHEDSYDDFESESLLPYRLSRQGPALAAGDVNGDGLDDIFAGNGAGFKSSLYMQSDDGIFRELDGPWQNDSIYEDTGALLFDADGDGRTDIYVTGGDYRDYKTDDYYHDRLYLNTAKGFIKSNALPQMRISGKCVAFADFDGDGDQDIFTGGRFLPGKYPHPGTSYLLLNNGAKGEALKFEDVTESRAPDLRNAGMVTDGLWDDFDGDGDPDLILVGEWMKISFYRNDKGNLSDVSDEMGFANTVGWWYSIKATDIDGDGDRDLIAGNLGLNSRFRQEQNPEIFAYDFDVNGKEDVVMGYTIDQARYPANSFNATLRQIPVIGQRYRTFNEFSRASLEEIYGKHILAESYSARVNIFSSIWMEKTGKSEFIIHPLPVDAQVSSINAIAETEFKGRKSLVIAGNLYNTEVETPRNDASVGLILQYQDNSGIIALQPYESGLMIRGEVKKVLPVTLAGGRQALLFGINNDALKLIEF